MTGPRQSPQAASRRALADAYEQAVKAEGEKRARARVTGKQSRRRVILLGMAWLVILGSLGTMALNPEFFGLKKVPETPAERDASIRLSLYVAGRRLEIYRKEHGRYPARLQEAGDVVPGIQYQLTADGGYEMRLERGGQLVLLTSKDSLDAFVGPAMQRVMPRRRP